MEAMLLELKKYIGIVMVQVCIRVMLEVAGYQQILTTVVLIPVSSQVFHVIASIILLWVMHLWISMLGHMLEVQI